MSTKRKPVPFSEPPGDGDKKFVPRRKPVSSSEESVNPDDLLVIEAPFDSGPDSPVVDLAPDKGLTGQNTGSNLEQGSSATTTDDNDDTHSQLDNSQDHAARQTGDSIPQPSTPTKNGMEMWSASDGLFP